MIANKRLMLMEWELQRFFLGSRFFMQSMPEKHASKFQKKMI